ncbi:homeobox-leucine zipper protein REVOLUTA [Dorcoceras hygrometricum]|uniref:Homeobox-leucine zipper protein REVOLUTA n=1 Tax=Dorcoceras hygrometricum TaxID=472368 RepID=A0A2Z6ZZH2_9LAMI|nr:homeobox-leucine zipper protein REVOLUTA [Dorcoceras hygrometricum]
MARTDNHVAAGRRGREEGHEKHIRYTDEQIRVLERAFSECSNPDRSQREQLKHQHPILNGIDNKQLKIWFQNHRSREKQKKEHGVILAENTKLQLAMKLLREDNNVLLKRVAELVRETDCLRSQILTSQITTVNMTKQASEPQPHSPQRSGDADDDKGVLVLAAEARNEFLAKATGTAIEWVPFPVQELKGKISVGGVYVSYRGVGVAARACVLVPFEPLKVIEILKDTPSWSRKCRKQDVLAVYQANNCGTVELVYTQYYAPTTLACARDLWTLRYTSILEDGTFVVCEKSINAGSNVLSSTAAPEFVRAKMLASGYLIYPCEGGSIVNLVVHLDLEVSSVPEVVRPLYESSELIAKDMIFPALQCIEQLAREATSGKTNSHPVESVFVRSFCQKLSRGFNDAVNGFNEDGWQLMNMDAPENSIISMKRTNGLGIDTKYDGVICVKTTVLLQNIFPAKLVGLLKDHRSTWMDFNFDDKLEEIIRAPYFAFPGVNTHNLLDKAVPLGHTHQGEEVLEVIQFESFANLHDNGSSVELYHLQVVNGMESMGNSCFGASSEFIFAPIDKTLSNEAVLLSSGFRVLSVGSKRVCSNPSLSSIKLFSAVNNPCSMMILAFQFPFETRFEEDVRSIALEYIQHVISSVKNIVQGVIPSGSNPERFLGVELCDFRRLSTCSFFELVQTHPSAILCFSFASVPMCLYANQAAVDMLETGLHNLQTFALDQILDVSIMYSVIPTILEQGYAALPHRCCRSTMDRRISYEQGVAWRVEGLDGSCHCFAAAFINWSFD